MKTKTKSIILGVGAIAIAAVGINLQATTAKPDNDYTLANLNALKSSSKDLECPSIYDVPYASIQHETKKYDNVICTVDGGISGEGFNFSGSFEKGTKYSIVIDIYSCKDEKDKIVCCKTEDQRTELVGIE